MKKTPTDKVQKQIEDAERELTPELQKEIDAIITEHMNEKKVDDVLTKHFNKETKHTQTKKKT